jgi:hypothetical protein
MRVADFISDLKAAGFSVIAQGPDLVVMPASKLFCRMGDSDAQSLFDGFTEAGDRSLR